MILETIGEGGFSEKSPTGNRHTENRVGQARTPMETMKLSKADLDEVAARHPNVKKIIDDIIKKRVEDTIKIVLDMNKL